MLLRIVQYLPVLLIASGLLLGVGSFALRFARKEKLTPRGRSLVFFWGSVGFWSTIIGAFMIFEKLID